MHIEKANMRLVTMAVLLGICAPALAQADTAMPTIIHEACAYYVAEKPFEIIVRIEDASELFDPKVIFRERGDRDWKNVPLTKQASEDYGAVIHTGKLRGSIEYFIETFDEHGNGPARLGSPEAPMRMRPTSEQYTCAQVPPRAPAVIAESVDTTPAAPALTEPAPEPAPRGCDQNDRPFYCEPWLWATVGTLALAGGGAAMYFLVFKQEETPPRSQTVTLTISGPDPTAMWSRP